MTGGLLSLVYGFTRAQLDGWASTTTLALLGRCSGPADRLRPVESAARPTRSSRCESCWTATGAARSSLPCWWGSRLFGTFLFLTYYLQGTLHYSALKSGFAFLPFSGGIIFSATWPADCCPAWARGPL